MKHIFKCNVLIKYVSSSASSITITTTGQKSNYTGQIYIRKTNDNFADKLSPRLKNARNVSVNDF